MRETALFLVHWPRALRNLQAGDGQLRSEVLEDGVGEAQVSLSVLKVDRVHLVRHRR